MERSKGKGADLERSPARKFDFRFERIDCPPPSRYSNWLTLHAFSSKLVWMFLHPARERTKRAGFFRGLERDLLLTKQATLSLTTSPSMDDSLFKIQMKKKYVGGKEEEKQERVIELFHPSISLPSLFCFPPVEKRGDVVRDGNSSGNSFLFRRFTFPLSAPKKHERG